MELLSFSPGKVYGVLKAKITTDNGEYKSNRTGMSHYNLITTDDQEKNPEQYQVNIDIQSLHEPNVHIYFIDNYKNSLLEQFSTLDDGFTPLESNADTLALDYIRENLFPIKDLTQSTALSADEIASVLDKYLESDPNIIVFGTKYDDKTKLSKEHYGKKRALYQNKPTKGVDDVHLNQTVGKNNEDEYQDGALFVETEPGSYTAFFFAFTNQCESLSTIPEAGNSDDYTL
ncbi:unnamed protein product [Didymodactylos carnosus]|uniref:Uncharacterized protein n=1 Tax=Didymodactylos carnosus TaxID=1234261 RepID=A0A813S5C5_9BILA|nr:unnamed protein product [Didymodactylos carnosus]CAF1593832.1 unnamed protein product [Didymodactylos carnosus]CAF3573966.1 unnamed protein product [Didymodactylos carnosus]CAF4399005.1 unnamed protein product [Didymodactylos carnosus]